MEQEKDLRDITVQEFAELGAPEVVYIRPVIDDEGNKTFFVHAANGQPLGGLSTYEEALAAAQDRDLLPVSVH